MAKKFFYVCSGLFLLLASYHLGAARAVAEVGGLRVLSPTAVELGGAIYRLTEGCPPSWVQVTDLPPVPVSSIVAFENYYAVTTSGEGWMDYNCTGSGGDWLSAGVPPGAVPGQRESWGAVKQRYR